MLREIFNSFVLLIPVFILLMLTFGAGFAIGRISRREEWLKNLPSVCECWITASKASWVDSFGPQQNRAVFPSLTGTPEECDIRNSLSEMRSMREVMHKSHGTPTECEFSRAPLSYKHFTPLEW